MNYVAPAGYDFEIPDEWLDEAAVQYIRLEAKTYPAAGAAAALRGQPVDLPLEDILVSLENRPTFNPPGPFERHRMVDVLRALRDGSAMQRVWVIPLDPPEDSRAFKLIDGHHRYHACVAMGLVVIPALVLPADRPAEWEFPSVPCGCRGLDSSCPVCLGSGIIQPP